MPLGAAPKQKTGPYEEREVGNLSQGKGKKTIRPKGWERARIRETDLQQSRDDPDGNDDRVKHDGSHSQLEVETAIARRHKAALQREKHHPAGHQSAMDVTQGSTLLRNGLSRIVEAVQVEHVKADGHADEHNDAGNHVEKALSSLPLKRPSVWRGRCNSGTHRLSPRRSFSSARKRTQKSEIDVSDANQAWNSSSSHIAKAHVGICAGQLWYYVRSTPRGWSANRKLSTNGLVRSANERS